MRVSWRAAIAASSPTSTLPPDSTATVEPDADVLAAPLSKAASATAPAPSTTSFDRSTSSTIASAISSSLGRRGSGAFGGTAIPDAAGGALAADATLIAPAGPAFSIWSVIYLGLVAYTVWQALPGQAGRPVHRRVGYWIAASLALNAAWIGSVQADLLGLSVVVIVALLVVLVLIMRVLASARAASWQEAAVVDGTFGLYLGWVSVATVANVAAWLADSGVRPEPFELPAMGVLAVVVVIGGLGSMRGALAGALIVGLIRAISLIVYPEAELLMIYVIVIGVLLLRPAGLFGKPAL